jgi:DNA helicase II / ATP-dependent DNA helicase PcrA
MKPHYCGLKGEKFFSVTASLTNFIRHMENKKNPKEDLFLERYNKLTDRQREAVDTIYGPVMVIAGPGTGKTEVLAMRIANLLRSEAQVQPHEILCLTYTDEATNSMRRRLVQIVGPVAHKVNIHSFHAFCNTVIQNNSEYFSRRELAPISELELADLMHAIVDELPSGHPLRRLSGDVYYEVGKLKKLFEVMKREHLTPEAISAAIDDYLSSLPEREEYIYKRNGKGFKKGDLKQADLDKETDRMVQTRAAANLFDTFQERMKEMGRYDFNDMILWVIDAFTKHQWLLQSYQERYQFILVDEFQDTNGSQNEILNFLTSYWEEPNVFVVGDDDQSIYEFQGARIRNIIDFYERHREGIKVVVLPHNYRSSQAVIDKAMASIGNNKNRLINQLNELQLDKNIVAAHDRFRDGKDTVIPQVKVYPNQLQEEAGIVMQIEQLQASGVPLREIAVLYSRHALAANITALLERKGIPYNVKKPVDILQLPLINQILNVLRYIDAERRKPFDGEALLFELMHAPYFGIDPNDIALLALYIQTQRKEKSQVRWRLALSNSLMIEALNLKSAKAMHRLGRNLDDWERQQLGMPLPLLVEKIIHEGGIVAHLVQTTDHVWALQVLNSFFEFVKESHARDLRMKPGEFLRIVDQMLQEKIALQMQRVVQSDNGVNFFTAHGAKGNEFEYVFLIGCNKNNWEKKSGGRAEYKLPDTITATADDAESSYQTEVSRRLFYVALTRARKHLVMSYPLNDNNGKGLEASVFVDEVCGMEDREIVKVLSEDIVRHIQALIQPVADVRIKTANAEAIERMLQQLTMSATQLSKFLKCPLSFYYERILKVPTQKSDAMSFGTAVHYALEHMFIAMKANGGTFPDKEQVLAFFKSEMYRESAAFTDLQFERRMEQGNTMLSDYYDYYVPTLHKEVELEFNIPKYLLDGVPVTGKIDKIELHGDSVELVDYKTGDPGNRANANLAPPNEKEPLGGDYWRQMVFYKMILEHYEERNWRVSLCRFDYIQTNKSGEHKHFAVPVSPSDEAIVMGQLKDAYLRIMNHEFDRGCGGEECHWCNFARRYELIRPVDESEMDDDE